MRVLKKKEPNKKINRQSWVGGGPDFVFEAANSKEGAASRLTEQSKCSTPTSYKSVDGLVICCFASLRETTLGCCVLTCCRCCGCNRVPVYSKPVAENKTNFTGSTILLFYSVVGKIVKKIHHNDLRAPYCCTTTNKQGHRFDLLSLCLRASTERHKVCPHLPCRSSTTSLIGLRYIMAAGSAVYVTPPACAG